MEGETVAASFVRAGQVPVTLRLPFSAASVAVARQRLRSWLLENDVSEEAIEDARVVISELVANSIRHASPLHDGNLVVSWTVEPDGLRVSVTDGGGSTRPRALHAASSAIAGRGMAIVESIASTWWHEPSESRSTVHALLPV